MVQGGEWQQPGAQKDQASEGRDARGGGTVGHASLSTFKEEPPEDCPWGSRGRTAESWVRALCMSGTDTCWRNRRSAGERLHWGAAAPDVKGFVSEPVTSHLRMLWACWARLKPRVRNCIQVSHMGGGTPAASQACHQEAGVEAEQPGLEPGVLTLMGELRNCDAMCWTTAPALVVVCITDEGGWHDFYMQIAHFNPVISFYWGYASSLCKGTSRFCPKME